MSLPNFIIDGLENLKDLTDVKVQVIKINPFASQTFSAAGTRDVTFRLPRDGVLVGMQSHLYFQAKPTSVDSNADAQFMANIASMFDNQRVEVGSTEIVNEQEWGWWKTLEFDAKASSTDRACAQAYNMNVIEHSASGAFTKFSLPLASKWWDNESFFAKPLPLYKMDQIQLTYTLNNTLAEYTTATTSVSAVDLQNVELELTIVDSPSLRKAFDRDIVREFTTQYHHYSLLTNGASQLTVNVPSAVQNLKGLAMLQRATATATDPNWRTGQAEENYKYSKALVLNTLTKFSTTIDGKQYPQKEIDGTNSVELITNLTRYWGLDNLGAWFDSSTVISPYGKGYYCVNYAADPHGVSGISTVSKSGNIVVNASLTAAQDTDIDIFVKYSKFLKIGKDGSVSVTK